MYWHGGKAKALLFIDEVRFCFMCVIVTGTVKFLLKPGFTLGLQKEG